MSTLDRGPGDSLADGIHARREVLGADHVDRSLNGASSLGEVWLDHAHRHAWGAAWTRTGLDRRTRSVITLSLLIGLKLQREIALHTRAALRNGLTPEEITELVIHASIYVGFPAAHEAFAVVEETLREEGAIA
jgi:alkylhydroperoxidase/carboxymuconolactone decarboxylase family protein YurZ